MNLTFVGQTGPKVFGTAQKKTLPQFETPDYPGPGTHQQIRFDESNPPSWKFGRTTDRSGFLCQTTKSFPSPDKYDPNPELVMKTQYPKYSIPKSSKPKGQEDENSALNYKPKYNAVKQKEPAFSFGYYYERDYSSDAPPPNEYFAEPSEQIRFNKTQNFFTKTMRPYPPHHQQAKFPGVGGYVLNQQIGGSTYSFGFANRPDGTVCKHSPGIYYDISGNMKKPGGGYSFRKKFPIVLNKDAKDFPSPDQYNPKHLENGQNIISFRGPRSTMHDDQVVRYPSPDKYANQQQFQKEGKAKSQSFALSQREDIKHNGNPGPDSYKVAKQLGKTLGLMSKKLKKQEDFINPAPDCYSPTHQLTKPAYQRPINLYSNRINFSKSVTGHKVGPGSYLKQPNWSRSELGKQGTSLKLHVRDNKVPGPGSYQIPGSIGKLPKYYCLPKKLDDNGNVLGNSMIMRQTDRSMKMKKFIEAIDQRNNIKSNPKFRNKMSESAIN